MFPGIYGFHWTPGYVIFLGIFYTVVAVIAATVLVALRRAWRAQKADRTGAIRWHADFEDLPARDRACRHDIDGRLPGRVCHNGFDCGTCAAHADVMAAGGAPMETAACALPVPLDRMYHRGHTWVKPQPDGTVLVGLDELAKRVAGQVEPAALAPAGTRVRRNGTAWQMRRNGTSVRVLAPVDGTVVETGGPESGWLLRIRPDGSEHPHLLEGGEARAWMQREVERVGMLVAVPAVGPALADGGVMVEDLPAAAPDADWDAVWGGVFLEP